MSHHTRFNTSKKTLEAAMMHGIFLGTNTVYRLIGPYIRSDFVFLLCRKVEILVIWNAIREFVTKKLMQIWWNPAVHARSHFYFLSSRDVVWLITTQNPSCVALRNVWLTVLLHNYQNLILRVVICRWCNVDMCRGPGNPYYRSTYTVLFESGRRQSVGLWSWIHESWPSPERAR